MNTFHITTIIIASIVFSGLFIYIAVQYFKKDTKYPPIIPNCPDLWKSDENENCIIPQSGNIGTLSGRSLYKYNNFSKSELSKGYSFLPEFSTPYKGDNTYTKGYYSYDIPYGFDPKNPTVINFNDPAWGSNGDPTCEMKKWANQNKIQWDGISAYSC
jgi:hypothetical protein